MLAKEQIQQIMEFVQANHETGNAFAIAIMDNVGHVRATFNANAVQLAFMAKVMDNTVSKMMDAPMPVQMPPRPPGLVPVS